MTPEELNAKAARNGPIIVAAEEVLDEVLNRIAKGETTFELKVFKGFSSEDFILGQDYVHRKMLYMLKHSSQKAENPTGRYYGFSYCTDAEKNGCYSMHIISYPDSEEEDERFGDQYYTEMLKPENSFHANAIDIKA